MSASSSKYKLMDYQSSLKYLYSLGHETLAMKLGLENISSLAKELGNPHQNYSIIHIAGTNGKGSFCATLASILAQTSIQTGLFTSPHLLSINERFQCNLNPIIDDVFCEILSKVKDTVDNLLENNSLESRPTFFEHVTAIALEYFYQCKVRLAILEVGLGGRLDSTNIVSPILTVITPIEFDHQKYLGNTLSDIAKEKAGILKPKVPALVAPQHKEVAEVIKQVAEEVGSPLIWLEDDLPQAILEKDGYWKIVHQDQEFLLGLRGYHQVITAQLALKAVELIKADGFDITNDNIAEGLKTTSWPARLELVQPDDAPNLLFDGAHNPHGANALKDFLENWLVEKYYNRKVLIFSVMQDKDFMAMAKAIFPIFDLVLLVKRSDTRAMQFEKLDIEILSFTKEIRILGSTSKALEVGCSFATPQGLVLISGSLHLIGEVKQYLKDNHQPYKEKPYGI